MKSCLFCKNEFVSKRKSAQFCSPVCRVMFHRKQVSVTKDIISVTESVTLTPKNEEKTVTLIKPVRPNEYKGKFSPFDFCPKHSVFYSSCRCGE